MKNNKQKNNFQDFSIMELYGKHEKDDEHAKDIYISRCIFIPLLEFASKKQENLDDNNKDISNIRNLFSHYYHTSTESKKSIPNIMKNFEEITKQILKKNNRVSNEYISVTKECNFSSDQDNNKFNFQSELASLIIIFIEKLKIPIEYIKITLQKLYMEIKNVKLNNLVAKLNNKKEANEQFDEKFNEYLQYLFKLDVIDNILLMNPFKIKEYIDPLNKKFSNNNGIILYKTKNKDGPEQVILKKTIKRDNNKYEIRIDARYLYLLFDIDDNTLKPKIQDDEYMAYYYAANEKQKEEIKKKYDNDLENQKKDIKERSFCILGKKQLDKNSNQDALITPEEYIIQQNKAIKTLLRPKDNMDVEVQKEKFEQFFETIIKDKHTDKKTKNPTFKFEIDNDESDFIFKISWIPDQKWHEPHHDYELYIKHPIKTLDNQKTIFCKQYKQLFYRFKILGFNTLMKIALIHEKDKILIDKENDNIKVIEINHNNKKIIINAKCHAKLNKFLHEIIKRNFINSISVIKFILEFEKLYLKYKDKSYINFDIKNVDDDWKEDTRSINDASKFFDILKEIRNAACHFDQPFLSEDDLKIFKDTFSNIINYIQDEILKEEKNTNTKSIVKTYKTKKKIFNEGNEVLQKYIINKMNEFYDKYKK